MSFADFLGKTLFPASSGYNIITRAKLFWPSEERLIRDAVRTRIRAKMIAKEGFRNDVYLDHLGKPTVGIGHLVVPADNLRVGDRISNERVEALFNADIDRALNAAVEQASELRQLNVGFVEALTQVNFQLGIYWRAKFPKLWAALSRGDKQNAVREITTSLWHAQTPVRTNDFIKAIQEAYA